MKLKIALLLATMIAASAIAMEEKERPGKRKEISENTGISKSQKSEKAARVESSTDNQNQFALIPRDIVRLIGLHLTKFDGHSWQALNQAATTLHNLMLADKSLYKLAQDMKFTESLIGEFARLYLKNDVLLAALVLNTPASRQYLRDKFAQKDETFINGAILFLIKFGDERLPYLYPDSEKMSLFLINALPVKVLNSFFKDEFKDVIRQAYIKYVWWPEPVLNRAAILNSAIRHHDMNAIEKLLHCNALTQDTLIYRIIDCAVEVGDVKILQRLLKAIVGLQLNKAEMRKRLESSLTNCARNGSITMLAELMAFFDKYAVKKQGIIDYKGDALIGAIAAGKNENAQALIENGSDINKLHTQGTPLGIAARTGNLEMVNYLIAKGVDINAHRKLQGNALLQAVKGGHADIVKRLIEAGIDIHCEVRPGNNVYFFLDLKVKGGKKAAIKKLVDQAFAREQAAAGLMAINAAPSVPAQNLSITNAIANLAVDADKQEMSASPASEKAAEQIPMQIVQKTDAHGRTDLIIAATAGDLVKVKELLKAGANINAQSPIGLSALMVAAYKGHLQTVRLLLQSGADVNLKDKRGNNALFYAQKSPKELVKKDIIELLELYLISQTLK